MNYDMSDSFLPVAQLDDREAGRWFTQKKAADGSELYLEAPRDDRLPVIGRAWVEGNQLTVWIDAVKKWD